MSMETSTSQAKPSTLTFIRQFKDYSLQSKLLIILIGITSSVILIVGAFSIFNISSIITAQEEVNQTTAITSKGETINRFLSGTHADVLFLSKSSALIEFLNISGAGADTSAALASLENEFLAFIDVNTFYDQVRYLDTTGQEIVRANRNADGNVLVVDHEDLQNKAGRYYFDDSIILNEGEVFVSPLDLNVEGGQVEVPHKPMIRYATPVYTEGTLQGVIITNVLAENFLASLGRDQSNTFLVDEDGYYLYHPEQDKRWGSDLGTEISIDKDYPLLATKMFAGDTSTLRTSESVFAHTPVVLEGEDAARWYLANLVSLDDATAPVRRTALTSVVVLLITMAIAIVIIFYLSRIISSPVIELTEVAERLGSGEYGVTTDIQSADEIGTLAKTFNTMSSQLSELIGTLEQRVADRTRALETSSEVSRRLSTILDRDQLAREVVEQLVTAFDYYYAHIYLYEEDKNTLVMMGGTGEAGHVLLARGHTVETGRGLVGRAAETNSVVLVSDTLNEEGWVPNELLPETRSEIAVPISIGDDVLGVFDVQHNVVGGITQEDSGLLQSIANQVAVAVQNAQVYVVAQQRAAHETLLGNIGQKIQNTTTVEDALQVAVRELGRALNAEQSNVQLNLKVKQDEQSEV